MTSICCDANKRIVTTYGGAVIGLVSEQCTNCNGVFARRRFPNEEALYINEVKEE